MVSLLCAAVAVAMFAMFAAPTFSGTASNRASRDVPVLNDNLLRDDFVSGTYWLPEPAHASWLRTPSAALPGDELWWDGFALPVVDGFVSCATVYDDRLIIGGRFNQVGGIQASNIAQWDGSHWVALGVGTDDAVACLLVFHGDLVVGGMFAHAGGEETRGIARWNGSGWSPLGAGLDDPQHLPPGTLGLGVYRDALVAAGDFTRSGVASLRHVASWNGSSWSPLGSGLSGPAQTLAVVGDSLFVGGRFDSAGATPVRGIAKWDGAEWSGVGGGVTSGDGPGHVRSIVTYRNEVIAGGEFDAAGGMSARNIAAWNGSSWDSLGSGVDGLIFALAPYGDVLFVGGSFGPSALGEWDGSSWLESPQGLSGFATTLLTQDTGLIVGGVLTAFRPGFGGIAGFNVVRWTGASWAGIETWTDRMHGLVSQYGGQVDVRALTSYQNQVVATGFFQYAGDPPGWSAVGSIVRWDGERWQTLPAPRAPGGANSLVSRGDTLYVGGGFYGSPDIAGPIPVFCYDGQNWTPLDTLSLSVTSLAIYQGELYAGGTRLSLSGPRSGGVYRWVGNRWHPVGSLEDSSEFPGILAMVEHGGRLVVGGKFGRIGDVAASNIAEWDGNVWQPLGAGVANTHDTAVIYALAEHKGELVAAGDFSSPRSSVATWDGSTWQPLGSGMGTALSLASIGGELFVGGWIGRSAVDPTFRGVARWDGLEWRPLGSGTNGPVRALLRQGNRVFMGGQFTQAGGRSSFGVARWDGLASPPLPSPLSTGAPNPFVTSADFTYRLVRGGRVRISVLDVRGREVALLEDGNRSAGTHTVTWNGRDVGGRELPAGVYFVWLRLPEGDAQIRRTVRLR